jgi:5-methylcytosine-specific restriction protein A
VAQENRPGWRYSNRRDRLPPNWKTELKPEALRLNPQQICHRCGKPGGTTLDHKRRGDQICLNPATHPPRCQCNLDWIHDKQDKDAGRSQVNCHGIKTGREGAASRQRINREPEKHPAL